MILTINNEPLKLSTLQNLSGDSSIKIDDAVLSRVQSCRDYLDQKLEDKSKVYYGINTGFGSLHDVVIAPEEIHQLQENLVKSHACGLGEKIRPDIVKWILLLKIKNISHGHSAVRPVVLDRLVDMYNHDVLPVIYEQGSLGASGDLAPLAHMSLPLLGLGQVYYRGEERATSEVYDMLGWSPLTLQAKEGLALLNGTQFMSAHGLWVALETQKICQWSEYITALSIDAFDCKLEPFSAPIQDVRLQIGQIEVAERIRELLADSDIAQQIKKQTQDPYSFRCVPQVHGASYDVFSRFAEILEREINAVTDNPLIFPEEDLILSGGNFHGQPIAMQLDFMAMALSELANISERRIYQLISGQRGLPPFLVSRPGLHSGLMIAQYTAASIVSQSKQYCTPASIDSIVSSNGQEDHVSMGANAATKLIKVVENTKRVLAIELINASQALSYRNQKTSPVLERFVEEFRMAVPLISEDRILHDDMVNALVFLESWKPNSH